MKRITIIPLVILLIASCSNPHPEREWPPACCQAKPHYELPPGNIDRVTDSAEALNSDRNELAPVQRPLQSYPFNYSVPYNREFLLPSQAPVFDIRPSDELVTDSLDLQKTYNMDVVREITSNLESVTFLSNNHGFASFSHAPDSLYAMRKNLNLVDKHGGTDIYEFETEQGSGTVFKSLTGLSGINSEFWDSHPYAADTVLDDGTVVTLLLWSSDREHPYSRRITLAGDTLKAGNTDLYYAFCSDGKWSTPLKFGGNINSEANDGSPFLYCLCYNPVMFFSSNRQSGGDDYDIYSVPLHVDYQNRYISHAGQPELLDKQDETQPSQLDSAINSYADDRFPYVPGPIANPQNRYIFLSSDRNKTATAIDLDSEDAKDTLRQGKGGYDIYRFPLPEKYKCQAPPPPVITLKVRVLDATMPERPVPDATVKLMPLGGGRNKPEIKSGNDLTFELLPGTNYLVRGGSSFSGFNCDKYPDKVLTNYRAPLDEIMPGPYDSLISTYSYSEIIEVKSLSEIGDIGQRKENEYISMQIKNNYSVEVKTTVSSTIEKIAITAPGRFEVHYRLDSIARWRERGIKRAITGADVGYDQSQPELTGADLKSEISKNLGIRLGMIYADTTIYDTVYVVPEYFYKPPCHCEFVQLENYYKNVPYFQTGFWKVNCSGKLGEQLNMLNNSVQEGSRSPWREARWIELHPDNRYWGDDEEKRQRRIKKYENYAWQVHQNLRLIASTITDNVLPEFSEIDSLVPDKFGAKLLITINAYSDPRPVDRGWYIGEEVKFVEGGLNEGGNSVDLRAVNIKSRDTLGATNSNLSRLRAYYGYREILSRIENAPILKRYMDQGQVYLPDAPGASAMQAKVFENHKIIIMARGRFMDLNARARTQGYTGDSQSDFYKYDTVRRVNVDIRMINYQHGRIYMSECCNPGLSCSDFAPGDSDESQPIIRAENENTNDQVPEATEQQFMVSLGSFAQRENAEKMAEAAREAGLTNIRIILFEQGDKAFHRVGLGPLPGRSSAEKLRDKCKSLFDGAEIFIMDNKK